MDIKDLGNGVYLFLGKLPEFPATLSKFKANNLGLVVTAYAPHYQRGGSSRLGEPMGLFQAGYVVNTEEVERFR